MKRGSALIMALWIIAILSVMVLSFASEARLHSGINVYVRERNRVNRLVEAGQVLAEVVLLGYGDVPEQTEDEDLEKLLEDDRWILEKRDLKTNAKCVIGPILLNEDDPDSGTVKVEIETANSGSQGVININNLSSEGGDQHYQERWWMILRMHGIPEELSTEKDGTIPLWNILTASWNDWRDADDEVTQFDGEDCGAENKWYEDFEDDNRIEDEDRKRPRQAKIPAIRELGYIRGFREYPQVLTGGVINPWENKDDQITVKGIEHLFSVEGSAKINVNNADADVLMTVPGIFDLDEIDDEDDDVLVDAQEIADAIVAGKAEKPDYDVVDNDAGSWPYRDWNDLVSRVRDAADVEIGAEAQQYLEFGASQDSIFKVRIVCESMGMEHVVAAEGYVKDKKVRYFKWRED